MKNEGLTEDSYVRIVIGKLSIFAVNDIDTHVSNCCKVQ